MSTWRLNHRTLWIYICRVRLGDDPLLFSSESFFSASCLSNWNLLFPASSWLRRYHWTARTHSPRVWVNQFYHFNNDRSLGKGSPRMCMSTSHPHQIRLLRLRLGFIPLPSQLWPSSTQPGPWQQLPTQSHGAQALPHSVTFYAEDGSCHYLYFVSLQLLHPKPPWLEDPCPARPRFHILFYLYHPGYSSPQTKFRASYIISHSLNSLHILFNNVKYFKHM